jgi:hypothetical protein
VQSIVVPKLSKSPATISVLDAGANEYRQTVCAKDPVSALDVPYKEKVAEFIVSPSSIDEVSKIYPPL